MQSDLWHALTVKETAAALRVVPEHGLTAADAAERQKTHGPNELKREDSYRMLRIILRLLTSPLSFVLVVVGCVTLYLHEWVDSAVIFLVLLVNVGIGAFQEGRARKVLDMLAASQEKSALVLRDGKRAVISARDVVLGDILLLEGGASVVADARLVSAEDLSAHEAALTGEWVSVSKQTKEVASHTPLAERDDMVWSGTSITSGHGSAIVVGIGMQTALGKIAVHLTGKEAETPLAASVHRLARTLMFAISGVILLIVSIGLLQGAPFGDILLIAVALAVAVMPEGLPAAVTVVLAVGMETILKKKGLVRSLLAAETLGSTTVIITDKTGTLTEAQMSVSALYTARGIAQKDSSREYADNHELLKAAILASDAFVTGSEDGLVVHGRPVEKALLTAGLETGLSQDDLFAHGEERLTYLQFESFRRYGASLNEKEGRGKRIYISGSPEALLAASTKCFSAGAARVLDDETRKAFEKVQRQESRAGHRFIAVAYAETEAEDISDEIRSGTLPKDTVFAGLIAFSDTVRPDVAAEIARAREAGILVIMATGDFPETAKSIAREVGLADEDTPVVTGNDMEQLDDEALLAAMRDGAVFARVVPEQKLRMVRVLRGADETVAMTGDGVNDAPALVAADIGVAVGAGTDVAKEASDIILLNNTFSTITAAIAEGRRIGDNLRRIISYLLSTSFSEIVLIGGAIIAGLPLPLLPVQVLWANVIEEGIMSFPFAFEPQERDAMRRKPERLAKTLLTGAMWKLIAFATVVTGTLLLGLYYTLMQFDMPIEEMRTVLFVALTLDALLFTLSFKDLHRPLWSETLFNNKWVLIALGANAFLLLLTLTFPPLSALLSLSPLSFVDIGMLLGLAVLNVLTIEFGKWLFFRKEARK